MHYNCKGCLFNVSKNKKQISCLTGRIETFKNKGKATLCTEDMDSAYYNLDQLCNMNVTDSIWNNSAFVTKKNNDKNELLAQIREKIKPTFGIAIYCDDSNIEGLSKTIESLRSISYDKRKVKIVISTNQTANYGQIVHVINQLQSDFVCESVFHLHDKADLRDTECFVKLTEAMFFVKMASGDTIAFDLFDKIDRKINEDLDQTCMFEQGYVTIILKHLMQNSYLDFKDYDLATNHIRSVCIQQDKYEKL